MIIEIYYYWDEKNPEKKDAIATAIIAHFNADVGNSKLARSMKIKF